MMILLKILTVPLVGAGAIGTMSPLIYIGTTSSTFKTSWKGQLSSLDPVLQDCKASDEKYYTVLLDYNPEGGAETSSNNPEISFRVEETSSKWVKGTGKAVWKKGLTQGSLGDWGLQPQTKTKFDFMYPDPSGIRHGNQIRKLKATCTDGLVIESTQGFNNTIELSELKLTLTEEKSCQSSFGYKECAISIGPTEKLKWKLDSEPKVIYRAI